MQPNQFWRASGIDGDTLEIRGDCIRINGVDAPEAAQLCKDAKGRTYRCGAVAAMALAEFIEASSPVSCEFVTLDRYGRFVGNSFREDRESIAVYIVRNGLALDWPQYSNGQYAQEQARAKAEKPLDPSYLEAAREMLASLSEKMATPLAGEVPLTRQQIESYLDFDNLLLLMAG